jgi:hypothetical protein
MRSLTAGELAAFDTSGTLLIMVEREPLLTDIDSEALRQMENDKPPVRLDAASTMENYKPPVNKTPKKRAATEEPNLTAAKKTSARALQMMAGLQERADVMSEWKATSASQKSGKSISASQKSGKAQKAAKSGRGGK